MKIIEFKGLLLKMTVAAIGLFLQQTFWLTMVGETQVAIAKQLV